MSGPLLPAELLLLLLLLGSTRSCKARQGHSTIMVFRIRARRLSSCWADRFRITSSVSARRIMIIIM
jgi:hypothetical protein